MLYVAPTGSDTAAGTLARPLRTVQRCVDLARPGTTCVLRAGTYRETVRVPRSGTAPAPITLTAYGRERAVVSGAPTVSGWRPCRGHVYRAPLTLPAGAPVRVLAAGTTMTQARWPNTGTALLRPTLAACCVDPRGPMDAVVANAGLPDLGAASSTPRSRALGAHNATPGSAPFFVNPAAGDLRLAPGHRRWTQAFPCRGSSAPSPAERPTSAPTSKGSPPGWRARTYPDARRATRG